MTIHELENREIIADVYAPFVYFTVHVFPDGARLGKTLPTAYKTEETAKRAAVAAVKKISGEAHATIRKEEVVKRIPGKLEISSSGITSQIVKEKR